MSANSKRIVVKVRFSNQTYYALKEYSEIHFASRNKIINQAVELWLKSRPNGMAPK